MKKDDKWKIESAKRWWNDWGSKEINNVFVLDRWAEAPRGIEDKIIRAWINDVIRKIEPSGKDYLIEVGCGAGLFLKDLSQLVNKAVGLDFSLAMLYKARNYCNSEKILFFNAEASKLPFRDSSFTKTLCYGVFSNLPSWDYDKIVIAELIRITKPGGIVLIGALHNEDRKEELLKASKEFNEIYPQKEPVFKINTIKNEAFKERSYSLTVKYYKPWWFYYLFRAQPHSIEILPTYNIHQKEIGGNECNLNKFDVRIRVVK